MHLPISSWLAMGRRETGQGWMGFIIPCIVRVYIFHPFSSYVGAWMERGGHKSCHHEGAKLVDLWASKWTRLTMEIWFERA